jgi:RNA polymerase sigma-70 factor (ECF subfamily)
VHGERYDGVPQADAPLAPGTGPAGRSTPVPQQRPVTPSAEEHPVEPSAEEGGTWTLVKRCQAGDLAAFSELYEKYHEVVYRYVLFRMGDRTLAEDLTQETFVRALRRIGSVSYQGRDIGAWFVTIARNLIFDHVKSSRYRLESTTSEIADYSPTTQGPEQQVLENATNDELRIAIAKLNPDQQECIRMRFLQGLSVAETAERMQRNEGAVKALQHRAVRRLATLLPDGVR